MSTTTYVSWRNKKHIYFFFFFFVVEKKELWNITGTRCNCLSKITPMSTHNKHFRGEIRKIFI